jgi:membrane protein YqaA with SNARE-associated domain
MRKFQKILGVVSFVAALISLLVPLFIMFVVRDTTTTTNFSYLGFFFAVYVGYGMYLVPFLVHTLNPIALILIGAFGVTIDEFFAWYAGKVATELDKGKKWHKKINIAVERYGMYAVFTLGLLPLPGFVYVISGFAVGHHQISFFKFFTVNFTAKLIRTTAIVVGSILIF